MNSALKQRLVEPVKARASSAQSQIYTEAMANRIGRVLDLVPDAEAGRTIFDERAWFVEPAGKPPIVVVQVVASSHLFEAVVPIEDTDSVSLAWLALSNATVDSIKQRRDDLTFTFTVPDRDGKEGTREVTSRGRDDDNEQFARALAQELWATRGH